MYTYIKPTTIIECGECNSRNIARKLVQFADMNVSGRLVCLDCGHTERVPAPRVHNPSTDSNIYTVPKESRIVTF